MGYKIKRIYQGTNLVRPAGWKPGSNTIAYYPLTSNGNDYSGNNHNLTWDSTPTYTISGGTKTVALLNGSNLGKIANLSGTYTNYTFSFWAKPTSTGTWQEIFDNYAFSGSSYDNVYLGFNSSESNYSDFFYQYRPNGGRNYYQKIYGPTNRIVNIRYNVCVTSTSSGIKIYVNGTQIASNGTTGAIKLDSGYNQIGGRDNKDDNTHKNFFNGYLSEFIFESKTWTAEEVYNYYNQTKSNYGL